MAALFLSNSSRGLLGRFWTHQDPRLANLCRWAVPSQLAVIADSGTLKNRVFDVRPLTIQNMKADCSHLTMLKMVNRIAGNHVDCNALEMK